MGWAGALAKTVAKDAITAPHVEALKANASTTALGAGIGAALPADSQEERLRNMAILAGGAHVAKALPTPAHTKDVSGQSFGGTLAKTADLKALEKAKALESTGADPKDVWGQTGWFKGLDDQWRFEIADDAKPGPFPIDGGLGVASIGKLVENDPLFAAYPELKQLAARVSYMGDIGRNAAGDPAEGPIASYNTAFRQFDFNNQLKSTEASKAAGHELQHAVQDIEGFAQGGGPKAGREFHDTAKLQDAFVRLGDLKMRLDTETDPAVKATLQEAIDDLKPRIKAEAEYQAYRRLPGEVEARLVEKRLGYSPEERRAKFPLDDIDVPRSQVAGQGGKVANSGADGLPMDEPARMARAKADGFDTDTVLYHGTRSEITAFDANRSPEKAVFLSESPADASNYATGAGYSKGGQPNVIPTYIRGKIKTVDMHGGQYVEDEVGPLLRAARSEGFDGVRFTNMDDIGGASPQIAIFDPKNIRSKFAKFDPAQRDSANISMSTKGPRLGTDLGKLMDDAPAADKAVARITGDPAAKAAAMANEGKGTAEIFAETGRVLLERNGKKVHFQSDGSSPEDIIRGFDEWMKKPEGERPEWVRVIDEATQPDKAAAAADESPRIARAKEMGFDTDLVLYHGSPAIPNAFVRGDGVHGFGVYFTTNSKRAEKYGPNVGSYYIRGKLATPEMYVKWTKETNDSWGAAGIAKENGYAGIRIDDNEVLVFDAANIRSVDAEFDPKNINSRLLLASAPLVGVAGISAAGEGEAELSPQAKAMLGLNVMNTEAEPAADIAPKPAPTGWQNKRNPTYERFQSTTIPGMEAAPETVGESETNGQVTRPDGSEVWGAAFRMENVIGSMLSREKQDNGEYDPDFDPLSKENLEGFEPFADRFIDVRTKEAGDALKLQITREIADRETLMRSGWGGVGAMIVAGTVDPTILIPVGGQVKKGESLLKIGGRFAVGAGGGAVLSEGILQNTQELRTGEESALNIGGAVLLGGILGTGGGAGYRAVTGKPIMGFDPEFNALAKKLEDEMVYRPDDDPMFAAERADMEAMEAGSVGAAATRRPELADYELAPSMKAAEATTFLNPILRVAASESPKAREVGAMLMENGMYLSRNKDGLASPVSVEQNLTEYRGWHAEAQRTAQKQIKAHRKAGGKLSTSEFYNEVGRALRRGDVSEDPAVQAAAKAYRVAIDKTKERAIEMGLLPKDVSVKTADSYFHRMWNRNAMIRKPDDFKRMVAAYLDDAFEKMRVRAANLASDAAKTGTKLAEADDAFVKQVDELMNIERVEGSLEGYRNESVEHIYDTLMGHDSRTMPVGITAGPRGPLKERTFNIPDLFEGGGAKVEDFLVNDAQEVMDRYMRVMSADIELTRAFGSVDMADTVADIMADYKKLISAASGEAAKKRLTNEMQNTIRDIEGMRDVMRGNFGKPTYDNLFARSAAAVRAWNYVTMLGGMTISALPDIGNKVLSNGLMGIARDLVAPLIADLGKAKIAATEARTLGIAVERTLATRIASMADIGDVYGRATTFERGLGAMTNHFTSFTGMRLWNDVMKQADYITASNRAVRGMERPNRMGKVTKTWLANLGIGEADYPRIMAQINRYGETSGAMKLTHADQWDDPVAKRIWTGAMGKNANIQTVTPGIGDRPLMMNSELGKTIGQFKTFVAAANQRVTIRGAQQARMGHARVVSGLATYISLGMVVYYLKTIASGREPSEDPATWVREGVDRSGVVSIFMEGFNTAEKVSRHTFVGDSPASRYASRGAFAAALGPSVGKVEDAVNFIGNSLDGDLKDRDIHALRKLLPYNNIFWLRSLFDEMEIAATEATDAEETDFSKRRESILN